MTKRVVIWLTEGGIPQCVADDGVDVLLIDFMDLEQGDEVPSLIDAEKAFLKEKAPAVLESLEKYRQSHHGRYLP
jgi:hypothetical protein